MTACCEVALPVPLDRLFTYAVRSDQLPQRGARVVVPFRTEKLIGVVTGLSASAPAGTRAATPASRTSKVVSFANRRRLLRTR